MIANISTGNSFLIDGITIDCEESYDSPVNQKIKHKKFSEYSGFWYPVYQHFMADTGTSTGEVVGAILSKFL
jgi:hypothetical protein